MNLARFKPLAPDAEHHHCRDQYERSERNSNFNTAHVKAPLLRTG
jgi:hypothetical protein